MFELLEPTKAKLINLFVLSQKNRQPDQNPGAKMLLEMTLPNDALSMFDGALKSALFTKHGKGSPQANLDGVEPVSDLPNLTPIGMKIGKLHWEHESTGYAVTILQGIQSQRSNIAVADSILSRWTLTPKEGGTVVARVYVESQDVSETAFGKLAKLKSREIDVMFEPPSADQRELNEPPPAPPSGDPAPAKRGRGHPKKH